MTEELREASERLRRLTKRMKVRLSNRSIAEDAIVREPFPHSPHGAERWITYSPGRQEYLRLRDDPRFADLAATSKFLDPDALNGYVAFPKRRTPRVPRNQTGGLLAYIPVHGGITWALKDSYMAVWGFDTMHSNSVEQPRSDPDWIRAQCMVLYRGLLLAEQLYPKFRRADRDGRIACAQQLLDMIEEQSLQEKLGFEGLIQTFFTGEI